MVCAPVCRTVRATAATVWIDPPEYYDPPGGLLVFDPQVPQALIYPPGGMTVQGHIRLIHHQLRQVRSALALAHALGRKLILPAVVCGYDKAWYQLGSHGEFGGAPPFVVPIFSCPLDHYLEPEMLDPVNTIREYTFLSNPRTPSAVKLSTLPVTIEPSGGAAEMARLAGLSQTKVLNVTNLASLPDLSPAGTQSLLSQAQKNAFKRKFERVGGSWCCAPKGQGPRSARFSLWHAM